MRFHVTFDIVTPDSAEHGDVAESGFILPGEWRERMPDALKSECGLRLRDAVALINTAALHDNGDGSFYEQDSRKQLSHGRVRNPRVPLSRKHHRVIDRARRATLGSLINA